MIVSCPNCETRFAIDREKLGGGAKKVRCGRCGHKWFASDPMAAMPPEAAASEPDPVDDGAFPINEDPFPDPFSEKPAAREDDLDLGAFDIGDIDDVDDQDAPIAQEDEPGEGDAFAFGDDDDDLDVADDEGEPKKAKRKGAGMVRVIIILGALLLVGAIAGGVYAVREGLVDIDALTGGAGVEQGGTDAPTSPIPASEPPPIVVVKSDLKMKRTIVTQNGRDIEVFEIVGSVRSQRDEPQRAPTMRGAIFGPNGELLYADEAKTRPFQWEFALPKPVLEPRETVRFRELVGAARVPDGSSVDIRIVE